MVSRKREFPEQLNQRLATSGLRFTPQRQQVYNVLLQTRDHPTAEEVFLRAKHESPDISMATVYNCLDALVTCGLVRQVNVNRTATRYCPNMTDHCHFFCEDCGKVLDVNCTTAGPVAGAKVPSGFEVTHYELSLRGLCPACAARKKT